MGVGSERHASAALPLGRDPVPIVQEARWFPRTVWMGTENITSTELRIPDSSARNTSLYRVSFLGRRTDDIQWTTLFILYKTLIKYVRRKKDSTCFVLLTY
jgi:hypothetical protein